MWQEGIVGICVLIAFAFILKRYLPSSKKSSAGCDGCSSSCASKSACGSSKLPS